MANMKEANAFENELAEILGHNGFWASVFPKAADGSQPADIIALNFYGRHLIDAKVCSKGRFVFERMEDNQISAMTKFEEKCGGRGWFALKYPDEIYILPYKYLLELRDVVGSKSISKIQEDFTLENWIYDHTIRFQ